jgi:aminoglycoside 2'-N-acetyltransferase I
MNSDFIVLERESLEDYELHGIHTLVMDAFEHDFSVDDWQHTFGGTRFLGKLHDTLIAHAAVVSRVMQINGVEHSVGYIEGMCVAPAFQKHGYGRLLLQTVSTYCLSQYRISMLSTDEKHFYRQCGWIDFQGKSYVRHGQTLSRSADEDGGLMLLSACVDEFVAADIACEDRMGDAW